MLGSTGFGFAIGIGAAVSAGPPPTAVGTGTRSMGSFGVVFFSFFAEVGPSEVVVAVDIP